MDGDALPTVDDVFAVHDDIVQDYGLQPGTGRPLARHPIESAIEAAAEASDEYLRAAILLRRIANAHVFEDGNKRTAYVTARTYLGAVGEDPAPSAEQRAIVMRHFKRFEVDELATWLRSGKIDESRLRREYPG